MKRPYTYIIVLFFSFSFLLPGAAQIPPKKQKKIPERTDTTKTITKKGTMTIRKTKIPMMNDIGF